MVDLVVLQSISYMAGALGVCVAAIYYAWNIKATLRTRQAQLFMGIYTQLHQKESQRQWFNCGQADYKNYEEFREKYGFSNNPEFWTDWNAIGAFLEGIGVLVQDELIDVKQVSRLIGGPITWWWDIFGSYILESRVKNNIGDYYVNTEYLVGRVKETLKSESLEAWRRDYREGINVP